MPHSTLLNWFRWTRLLCTKPADAVLCASASIAVLQNMKRAYELIENQAYACDSGKIPRAWCRSACKQSCCSQRARGCFRWSELPRLIHRAIASSHRVTSSSQRCPDTILKCTSRFFRRCCIDTCCSCPCMCFPAHNWTLWLHSNLRIDSKERRNHVNERTQTVLITTNETKKEFVNSNVCYCVWIAGLRRLKSSLKLETADREASESENSPSAPFSSLKLLTINPNDFGKCFFRISPLITEHCHTKQHKKQTEFIHFITFNFSLHTARCLLLNIQASTDSKAFYT